MKTLLTAAVLTLGLNAAFAQDTEAEIRKIDMAQAKITLRHGEIKKLDMPAMTMVFKLKDAKMAEGLAVGDKVSIAVEQIDTHYVVTAIEKKKP